MSAAHLLSADRVDLIVSLKAVPRCESALFLEVL